MPKLTKRRVEALKALEKDVFAWDSELRGFGVRVKPTGSRSYIVQYRNAYGRSRRHTIGQHGHLATEEARTLAKQLLAAVARGDDPADERRAMRTVPTVVEFVEQYLADYAQSRKKESTLQTDQTNLRCHIIPALGSLPITAVTHRDVVKLHQSMNETPGAANRTLQLLSNIMNVAEKWNLRPELTNPCRHVEKYKLRARERFLTVAELQRLGVVLRAVEHDGTVSSSAITAIRLLLFTGCRRGEILSLKWDYVDFQERCLRLPDSKTGAKTVHLNAPALQVLSETRKEPDNPYVIVGSKPGCHLVNLKKSWQRIRKAADLEEIRLHDLRHSFASTAVGLGEGLPIVGALLGHTQSQTTQRYAHLADDPVKRANERIGAALLGMMNNDHGEIVEMHSKPHLKNSG